MIEIPRQRISHQSVQPRHRYAWNQSRASQYRESDEESKHASRM